MSPNSSQFTRKWTFYPKQLSRNNECRILGDVFHLDGDVDDVYLKKVGFRFVVQSNLNSPTQQNKLRIFLSCNLNECDIRELKMKFRLNCAKESRLIHCVFDQENAEFGAKFKLKHHHLKKKNNTKMIHVSLQIKNIEIVYDIRSIHSKQTKTIDVLKHENQTLLKKQSEIEIKCKLKDEENKKLMQKEQVIKKIQRSFKSVNSKQNQTIHVLKHQNETLLKTQTEIETKCKLKDEENKKLMQRKREIHKIQKKKQKQITKYLKEIKKYQMNQKRIQKDIKIKKKEIQRIQSEFKEKNKYIETKHNLMEKQTNEIIHTQQKQTESLNQIIKQLEDEIMQNKKEKQNEIKLKMKEIDILRLELENKTIVVDQDDYVQTVDNDGYVFVQIE